MIKLPTIALALLMMSCSTNINRQPYTGPTDCHEVREKLKRGDIGEFKGSRAAHVLSSCVTPPGQR